MASLERNSAPAHPSRRRLAANVVCMFAEDRPPVLNVRRRGSYKGNIQPIRTNSRIKPGDIAELCRGALPENHGKRVRVLARDWSASLPQGEWWKIEALAEPLLTHKPGSDQVDIGRMFRCVCLVDNLRRVVDHG